jgi:hypothetical protein
MDMDAAKLRAAREILGTSTETETVDKALDYVVFTSDVFAAIDSLVALGGVDDFYAARKPARARKVAERRS